MNEQAAETFGKPQPAYPVGAIVVKEKHRSSGATTRADRSSAVDSFTVDGVGGMIKRPPGYDPAHGDWEYFYFEDPRHIEAGRMASCVQCHAAAADRDHVFGGRSTAAQTSPER